MHRCRDGSRCLALFHSQIRCIHELFSAEDQAFTTASVSTAAGSGSCLMHEQVVTAPRTIFPFQGRTPVLLLQVFGPVLPEGKCCVPGFSELPGQRCRVGGTYLYFLSTSEGTLPCLLCWHKVWNPLDQPLLRETLGLWESGVSYRAGIPWFCVWWGLVGREFANPLHESVSLGSLRLCR